MSTRRRILTPEQIQTLDSARRITDKRGFFKASWLRKALGIDEIALESRLRRLTLRGALCSTGRGPRARWWFTEPSPKNAVGAMFSSVHGADCRGGPNGSAVPAPAFSLTRADRLKDERALVDAWLAKNEPTQCPPCGQGRQLVHFDNSLYNLPPREATKQKMSFAARNSLRLQRLRRNHPGTVSKSRRAALMRATAI